MSLISVLTQFADRLDNVINAARLTNGVNSLSHERVAARAPNDACVTPPPATP